MIIRMIDAQEFGKSLDILKLSKTNQLIVTRQKYSLYFYGSEQMNEIDENEETVRKYFVTYFTSEEQQDETFIIEDGREFIQLMKLLSPEKVRLEFVEEQEIVEVDGQLQSARYTKLYGKNGASRFTWNKVSKCEHVNLLQYIDEKGQEVNRFISQLETLAKQIAPMGIELSRDGDHLIAQWGNNEYVAAGELDKEALTKMRRIGFRVWKGKLRIAEMKKVETYGIKVDERSRILVEGDNVAVKELRYTTFSTKISFDTHHNLRRAYYNERQAAVAIARRTAARMALLSETTLIDKQNIDSLIITAGISQFNNFKSLVVFNGYQIDVNKTLAVVRSLLTPSVSIVEEATEQATEQATAAAKPQPQPQPAQAAIVPYQAAQVAIVPYQAAQAAAAKPQPQPAQDEPKAKRERVNYLEESAALDQLLAQLSMLPGKIRVELIGTWVWVSGDTKPVKNQLKELGFSWHAKKVCWYLPLSGEYKPNRRGGASKLDIKRKYGVTTILDTAE